MLRNLAVVLGAFIAVAAIVVCAVPLVAVHYAVDVSYEDTETYYIKEEYTVQEPYTVQDLYSNAEESTEREPYNKSVPIDYVVTDEEISETCTAGTYVWVAIRNTDVKSGSFRVTFRIFIHAVGTSTKNASTYIAAGDTQRVQVNSSGEVRSFTYSITAPTKTVVDYRDVVKTRQVTEYRDVTKYRDVIEYRDVPKQRTVTKTRQETRSEKVTLLDYLLHY